jgi:hypothetical protein
MQTLNPFPNRYRPLQSNLTDTRPLIIDTEANPQDILEAALQRIRASSDCCKPCTANASNTATSKTSRTSPTPSTC